MTMTQTNHALYYVGNVEQIEFYLFRCVCTSVSVDVCGYIILTNGLVLVIYGDFR